MQKDQNGADIPNKDLFVRNIGAARAFGGINIGGGGNWTTPEFIAWLENQGAFNHPYWVCKGSWSYSNNRVITDTGCGNIHLAGAVIEVMGDRGAMTIRVTTPTTSTTGVVNAQFTYVNHGDNYSPGWRRDFNTANPPPAPNLSGYATQAWVLQNFVQGFRQSGVMHIDAGKNSGQRLVPAGGVLIGSQVNGEWDNNEGFYYTWQQQNINGNWLTIARV